MLRKIISIKNVGRFQNCGAPGDVELKRYSLIFAENGRGKTTLCAILRSLQSGEADHVRGRTTLGTRGAPEITILVDEGLRTFNRGAWSATVPNLAIFDSTFVSENVYSGDVIDLAHKRNLYGVIVGKSSVELAHQIEALDAATREKSTEIREKSAVVSALVPQGISVDQFLTLSEDTTIDAKIAAKEVELEAVKQGDQVKSRAALTELTLPAFPQECSALLSKTIEDIARDAELRVRRQIDTHEMQDRGEPWLSEGLSYVRDTACPFCGQSLVGVTLVDAYRAHFSEAYRNLRSEIAALRERIDADFADREIALIDKGLDQNAAAVEFWTRYCTITPPTLAGSNGTVDALRVLRNTTVALLDRKAVAPLDRVAGDPRFTAAYAAFVLANNDVAAYNQAVRAANTAVGRRKAVTAATNVGGVESALTLLRAVKTRHEPSARAACQALQTAQAAKKAIEDRKTSLKERLDEYTREVIGSYEQTVNGFLDDFQAGFRLTRTTHGYPGGVASASYQILINETAVDLGGPTTPADRPSFRNTLSSGDRSTLALAFFLAQLEHDPERGSKIVVFDDPFNSQDSFRKDCTVVKIKTCGDSCHQVIVLSHDQNFLKRVWDRLDPQATDRKCLQLVRVGVRDTKILTWDIERATLPTLVTERRTLVKYYQNSEGVPVDVLKNIRPVLETYCKLLFPVEFTGAHLGTIILKVRTAGASHQLFPLLDTLDALNEYSCRHHHGENPGETQYPINDTELQGFVKKTLDIVGWCE
jgi:wobble nucleotide-excising tRNase